jgi:malonyl CoA-acyl carrier protein transacylase
MGESAVDMAGVAVAVENVDHESPASEQFLPPTNGNGGSEGVTAGPDDQLIRLREDLRKLTEDVDAIDRRDAAQHGGLKGEIAHLVRRVARLEALPKTRLAR